VEDETLHDRGEVHISPISVVSEITLRLDFPAVKKAVDKLAAEGVGSRDARAG
jgi:hypothetical protein